MKSNQNRSSGKSGDRVRKVKAGKAGHIFPIMAFVVIIASVGLISLAWNLNDDNIKTFQTTETLSPETTKSSGVTEKTSESIIVNESSATSTATTKTDITIEPSDSKPDVTKPDETTLAETDPSPTTKGEQTQNGIVSYNGYADPRTINPQPAHDVDQFTVLVNKFYTLSADYEPELVVVPGTPYFLHPYILEPWLQMQADCSAATGVNVYLTSGYRSYSVQEYTFNDAVSRKGIALTVPYNALAGRSEHQLGLAVDVNDGVYKKYSTSFSQTATYAWLSEHAHEYGFILRYPKGKEQKTNYAYEPWHYRYVGQAAATEIYNSSMVLEEYHGV